VSKLKEIIKNLYHLSDLEFRQLNIQLRLASNIRSIKYEFNLSDNDICEYFGIKNTQLKHYLNGSYDFDIRDMAKIDVLYAKLNSEKNVKESEKYIKENHVTVNK